MSVRLRPSFFRCVAWVAAGMLVLTVITYFWEGYRDNHWWTRDYILSLLIPFVIAPFAIWLMFVPSHLELSDSHLTIKFPFRRLQTLAWCDLEYYGAGPNVFMIQFAGSGTLQIFPHAFSRSDWRMLKNFFSSTFPEKKASGFIGDRMFKWPRRQT
ncbi:MAG TPA: hypothetical protein VGW57_13475 [Chthoniobacterales bacterium]|nr:hypothetical protein [Chthoniobacterales bacterium]